MSGSPSTWASYRRGCTVCFDAGKASQIIHLDDLQIDLEGHMVRHHDRSIRVTRMEFRLLRRNSRFIQGRWWATRLYSVESGTSTVSRIHSNG